jgi:CMP-N,N'-diacetyllegionaminic acid synthase
MKPDEHKALAVIPARAGSKRLPGKNIRPLGGQPLIAWTIEAAVSAGVFDKVVVSTEDLGIAEVARLHGASVLWLRPAALSSDTATSLDVLLHAVDQEKGSGAEYDCVALLQPTSPFRTAGTIATGVRQCLSGNGMPVVAVSPARTHPELCFRLDARGCMSRYCPEKTGASLRSQDLPGVFEVNGALYVASVRYLRRHRTFFGPDSSALIMESPAESIDIDDDWDWQLAQWVVSFMAKKS